MHHVLSLSTVVEGRQLQEKPWISVHFEGIDGQWPPLNLIPLPEPRIRHARTELDQVMKKRGNKE